MAGRGGIEALLDLMDEAFRGRRDRGANESQALLTNLAHRARRRVARAAGRGAARRSSRSPSTSARASSCTTTTPSGRGTLRVRRRRAVEPWPERRRAARSRSVAWLERRPRAGSLDHVAALADDAELDRPRMTNWGELAPDPLDRSRR